MANEDRFDKSKHYLFRILKARGVIYTLGLCMGILCRLSRSDYTLAKELKDRADRVANDR